MNWALFTSEFLAILVSLFVITDPLGNVAIFLGLTEDVSDKQRRSMAFRGNLYALILLLIFLFGGPSLLKFLGITINAVDIGGGLIVGAVGWGLMRAKEDRKSQGPKGDQEMSEKDDISFCPLALPLIAGPGAIAVVINTGNHASMSGLISWIAATSGTIVAMLISWICLREAGWLLRVLGHNGMAALTRIVGFLLVCIAAQMIINGARGAFGWEHKAPDKKTIMQNTIEEHPSGAQSSIELAYSSTVLDWNMSWQQELPKAQRK